MQNIIILNSHPIQYFTPLYQKIDKDTEINLTVFFCSDIGARSYYDIGFGRNIKWDIPVLEGYKYVFLKNHTFKSSSLDGFWGALNLGIINHLWKSPKGVVLVFGWNYATNVLAIFFGRLFGHKICMRSDTPITRDLTKKTLKRIIRTFVFRFILFPFIHFFLYIGKQNKAFYKKYGVREKQLIFSPFAVDNDRFSINNIIPFDKNALRIDLGLPIEKRVFLFSGKLIPIKQPMQLIRAFHHSNTLNSVLVFIGDGELRGEMETYIRHEKIENIYIHGFINQTDISKYYAAADIFVMCSKLDAWGLSVNEAMNSNLPLLLSNRTCCVDDLLEEGKNGFSYQYDREDELTDRILYLSNLPLDKLTSLGMYSGEIIKNYTFNVIIEGFKKICI